MYREIRKTASDTPCLLPLSRQNALEKIQQKRQIRSRQLRRSEFAEHRAYNRSLRKTSDRRDIIRTLRENHKNNATTRLRIRNAFSDDERYADDRYETVFQRRLHHDLPPQTSYSEKIFTRRQRVAIGDSFPKKHYNIKVNPNHSLVTSIRFGLY